MKAFLTTQVNKKIKEQVLRIAAREQRSVSQVVAMLVVEALLRRNKNGKR